MTIGTTLDTLVLEAFQRKGSLGPSNQISSDPQGLFSTLFGNSSPLGPSELVVTVMASPSVNSLLGAETDTVL